MGDSIQNKGTDESEIQSVKQNGYTGSISCNTSMAVEDDLNEARKTTEKSQHAVNIIEKAMTLQVDKINELKELLRRKQEELERVRRMRTCHESIPHLDNTYLM